MLAELRMNLGTPDRRLLGRLFETRIKCIYIRFKRLDRPVKLSVDLCQYQKRRIGMRGKTLYEDINVSGALLAPRPAGERSAERGTDLRQISRRRVRVRVYLSTCRRDPRGGV